MKMKKILALLLTLAMVFALAACGGGEEKPTPDAGGEEKTGGYKIGLSNFSTGNTYRVQFVESVKYKCDQLKEEGIVDSCTILNCDGDANKQVSDIQDLIADGCDAILVTAATATNCNAIIEEAREQGIVVVSFNSQPSTEVDCAIMESEEDFGRLGAEWLCEKLDYKEGSKIVVLNGIEGDSVNDRRYQEPAKLFEQYGFEILTIAYCTWDYSQAKVAMESILAAYPEIDGIYSQGGAMTLAAIEAFEEAGRELVPMTGESNNGLLKKWKSLMEAGDTNFDCICPIVNDQTGVMALEAALQILDGKDPGKEVPVPLNVITAENIDEYVNPELPDSFWVGSILPDEIINSLFSN